MSTDPSTARDPSIAQCAVHEDAHASGTCERCGNFVCPLCLDPSSRFPDRCGTCRGRTDQRIAWEREEGSWLSRYVETVRDVLFRPAATFDRVGPGSLGASTSFAALTGLFVGIVQSLVVGVLIMLGLFSGGVPVAAGDPGLLGGALAVMTCVPVMYVVYHLSGALVWGLLYHLGVYIVGGRGGLSASLWSMGYLSALMFAFMPTSFLQVIPDVGPLLTALALFALMAWSSIRLTQIGQRYHELNVGRAALAAWFPVLLFVMGLALCCLGTAFMALVSGTAA